MSALDELLALEAEEIKLVATIGDLMYRVEVGLRHARTARDEVARAEYLMEELGKNIAGMNAAPVVSLDFWVRNHKALYDQNEERGIAAACADRHTKDVQEMQAALIRSQDRLRAIENERNKFGQVREFKRAKK